MTTVAPAPPIPGQGLLFGDHSVYPPVHHVSVEFEWISLADIFANYKSGDLPDWSEDSFDLKRSDPNYDDLVYSIQADGFYDPIFLNERGFVNNGHHRIAACVDLGYTHIPFTRNELDGFDNTSGVDSW